MSSTRNLLLNPKFWSECNNASRQNFYSRNDNGDTNSDSFKHYMQQLNQCKVQAECQRIWNLVAQASFFQCQAAAKKDQPESAEAKACAATSQLLEESFALCIATKLNK